MGSYPKGYLEAGLAACFLGIISGIAAFVFAFGVLDISTTIYNSFLRPGEGNCGQVGFIMIYFLNPICWASLTYTIYGIYARKGGNIGTLLLVLCAVSLTVSIVTAVSFSANLRGTAFPIMLGVFSIVLGATLPVLGFSILKGLGETRTDIERVTGILFIGIGVLSLVGPFIVLTIKWPMYILGLTAIPFAFWIPVFWRERNLHAHQGARAIRKT